MLDFEQLVLAWPPLCCFQCVIGVIGVFGFVSLDFEQLVLACVGFSVVSVSLVFSVVLVWTLRN